MGCIYRAAGVLLYLCATLSLSGAITLLAVPYAQAAVSSASVRIATVRTALIGNAGDIQRAISQMRDARDVLPDALEKVTGVVGGIGSVSR